MPEASPKHIAVVDPAVRVAELDNFNRMVLANPKFRFSYHLPAQFGMGSIAQLSKAPDAMIVFGSGASVYDNLPWQTPFHDYLLQFAKSGRPVLGICYGHQLLAHLFGGRIDFACPDQFKYKGLRTIEYTQDGFWGHTGETADLIVSHREVVVDLPDSCQSFARSEITGIEGLVHKTLPIWGIQAHPEAGPEFLANSEIPLSAEPSSFASGQLFLTRFFQQLSLL